MNNIDPGKDFKIAWEVRGVKAALSNPVHGAFIKEGVITPLFNQGGVLDAIDNAVVVGVGDKKGELKTKIDAAIRLNDLEKQQIVRLKFSATGVDARLSGFNLAHDAGPGPDKLFKEYTLVLTPGSVLDAAKRDKTHKPQMDGLAARSTINQAMLAQIGMQDALESIEYGGQAGGKYNFVFNTKIPGFARIEVEFDRQNYLQTALRNVGGTAFPAGLDLFAGNPDKNKFVDNHWNGGAPTPMNLAIILLLTLMKELGDTLQVIWLKGLLGPLGASADTTAICTHDTVVWLRAIINEVSCVFTEGNTSTFYPVAASEAQKVAAKTIIKQKLVDELVDHNSQVVRSIRLFRAKLSDPSTTFYDMQLDAAAIVDINMILTCLEAHIVRTSNDIITRSRIIPAEAIRKFVVSHKMKSPFHVIDRKTDVRHYTSFKMFLPLVIGENKIVFRPDQIYNAIKGGRRINVVAVLGEVPCLAALGRPALGPIAFGPFPAVGGRRKNKPMKGGAPPLSDQAEFDACINNNISSPGFISYFVINFVPEFMFIGYAYAKALEYPNFEKFDVLFRYDTGVIVNSHFGDLLNNNTFDTYPVVDQAQIDAYNNLMIELSCIIVASVMSLPINNPSLVIYDVFDQHTDWFITAAARYLTQSPPYPQIIQGILEDFIHPENASINGENNGGENEGENGANNENNAANNENNAADPGNAQGDIHWAAIEIYKDLYDAELSLCNLNRRNIMIPQEYIQIIRPAYVSTRAYTKKYKPLGKMPKKTAARRGKNVTTMLGARGKNSTTMLGARGKNSTTMLGARGKYSSTRGKGFRFGMSGMSGLSGFGTRRAAKNKFTP